MQKPHHIRGSFGQPTFALLAHANCCWYVLGSWH
jgi:hypothetical protein